ncbi:MAG TPA: hypothetical protein VF173_35065 [Thermoanaerobaculia bacterium]|nr:hypothetical protein [Thermoanaerobaculia bacterium]
MKRLLVCLVVLLTALLAFPAFAADRVIYNGIDLWRTVENGSTHADFSKTPIPAGFFCNKSEPFTGRIGFKGVPVATNVPGALEKTDTIVQRLDDAVFNKNGVAQTRLQVRSLNFESIAPVQTACGQFTAKVSLYGEQPVTRMRIIRENAAGGRFLAPISVNIKISFTPVGRLAAEPLEIRKSLRFPPLPNQRWESVPAQSGNKVQGFLLVDTDGDSIPDTYLPGTSNFGVGQMRRSKEMCERGVEPVCHLEEDDGQHCVC